MNMNRHPGDASAHHAPNPDTAGAVTHGAEEISWNLFRIYPDLQDPAVAADEKAATELVERLQAYRGTIAREDVTAEHLLRVIQDYERLETIAQRLRAFGYLHATVDHKNAEKTALHARLEEAQQRWSADLIFVEVELRQLPDARLAALADDPLLKPYRHFLERQRAQARYTLSEPEERVIAKKNIAGSRALVRFREEFAAKMDFGRFVIDGKERDVTQSDLMALRYNPDPAVRERARVRIFDTYDKHLDIYTFLYTSVAKDHAIECELRGHEHPMDRENVPNEIDGAIVQALIEVNRERLPMIHEFYGWKAKRLGLPKLKTSDLLVHLAKNTARKIRWDEAVEWISRAMERFSGEFATTGRRLLQEERIDAPPRKGKSGGGFCYPVPERDPFILVNYTGDIGALITLAHEVGHGIHFILSWENQKLLQAYWMSKVIAETASEFNELLLTDLLLDEISDPSIRQTLLGHMVDRFLSTVDRQLMFTEFEEAVHKEVAKKPAGVEFLNQTWTDLCRQHYGPHVDLVGPEHAGWATVPHFIFNPFYCYSYALSQVVVLALYATYREQGRDFAAGYADLLKSGGSGTPEQLLGKAGVDLQDRRVFEKAYDEFDRMLAALKRELGD
jgi:oligoendopeptidase F